MCCTQAEEDEDDDTPLVELKVKEKKKEKPGQEQPGVKWATYSYKAVEPDERTKRTTGQVRPRAQRGLQMVAAAGAQQEKKGGGKKKKK